MLENCRNCGKPLIYNAPDCPNHIGDPNWKPPKKRSINTRKKIPKVHTLSLEEACALTAKAYRTRVTDIRDPKRTMRPVVKARRHFMYITVMRLGYSYSEVAQFVHQSKTSAYLAIAEIKSMLQTHIKTMVTDMELQHFIAQAVCDKNPGA